MMRFMFCSVTLCSLVLAACVATDDASEQADEAEPEEEAAGEAAAQIEEARLEPESVLVDGVLYSRAQLAQRFEPQTLHWAVTQESLDRGIPMAFSTEEKREEALGRANAGNSMAEEPVDASASLTTYATLYEHIYYRGRPVPVSGNLPDLRRQGFNDKTSSVRVYGRPIIMYEHINMRGCSIGIDRWLGLPDLRHWSRCGRGSWNDAVSSVRVL